MRGGRPGAGARGGQAGIDFAPTTETVVADDGGAGSGVIKNTTHRIYGTAGGFAPDMRRSIHQSSPIPGGFNTAMTTPFVYPHAHRMYFTMFYVNALALLGGVFNFIHDATTQYGIYSVAGGTVKPGVRVWDSGMIDRAGAIYDSIPVGLSLPKGWYFFGGGITNTGEAGGYGCITPVIPDLGHFFLDDTSPALSGLSIPAVSTAALVGWTLEHTIGFALPLVFPNYEGQSFAGGMVPLFPVGTPHVDANGVGFFTRADGDSVPSAFAEWGITA